MSEQWIVIPRWDGKEGFQHYRDRDPVWIKNYRSLLTSEEYIGLTMSERGVLHGLWLEYASSNRAIRGHTATLTRRLGQRVTSAHLKALNDAGFIEFSASKPLARRYPDASPEREGEKETPLPPSTKTNKPRPSRRKPEHLLTHEEKNPYVCGHNGCGVREATERLLDEHRENVHGLIPIATTANGVVDRDLAWLDELAPDPDDQEP